MINELSLTWTDADGVKHTVGLEGATRTLAKFYERWPGGWSEVEAEDAARPQLPTKEDLLEMTRADIYVGDAGQAYGAEANPELALDPSFSPYYNADTMRQILNTSSAAVVRLKTLLNQAYTSMEYEDGFHDGFHDGFSNAIKRVEEQQEKQVAIMWNEFTVSGERKSVEEVARLIETADTVHDLEELITELQSSKQTKSSRDLAKAFLHLETYIRGTVTGVELEPMIKALEYLYMAGVKR